MNKKLILGLLIFGFTNCYVMKSGTYLSAPIKTVPVKTVSVKTVSVKPITYMYEPEKKKSTYRSRFIGYKNTVVSNPKTSIAIILSAIASIIGGWFIYKK